MDMEDIGSANCISSRMASWIVGKGVRAFLEGWVGRSGASSSWMVGAGLLVLPSAATVISGRRRCCGFHPYCAHFERSE